MQRMTTAFMVLIFCIMIHQPIQSAACGWAGDGESDEDDEVVFIDAAGTVSEDVDDSGGPKYQNKMGNLYRTGRGVPKNYQEAERWYRLAAEQGYAAAQNNLAGLYEMGLGIEKNDATAARWFRLAAEQGNAKAQHSIGQMHLEGRGVKQNFTEAAKWILKSAEQGHLSAMSKIGTLYWNGQGMERDKIQAYRWWKIAAFQGDKRATKQLQVAVEKMSQDSVAVAEEKYFAHLALTKAKRTVLALYVTSRQAYEKWRTKPG